MYNTFSKSKNINRIKSSNINVRKDLDEKFYENYCVNNNLFSKTIQKHPLQKKETKRPIKSSLCYRSLYIDDKIKLIHENYQDEKNELKYENKGNHNNKRINLDLIKPKNLVVNNKDIEFNQNYDQSQSNINPSIKTEKNFKDAKKLEFDFILDNNKEIEEKISNLNTENKTESKKNHSISSKMNINKKLMLFRLIYPEESSDQMINDSKKLLETKKNLRSRIYKMLKEKESIPLCDDFINKLEGFNLKLINSMQSISKLNQEKEKAKNFQFSKNLKNLPEKEYFTNIKNLKETKVPLEHLLKKNFTEEELNIIKYDFDFFNKNDKKLNSIKFLRPKSLLKIINEEQIKLEMEKRKKFIKAKKLKNMRAYIFLKYFINKKIDLYREINRKIIHSNDIAKNFDNESSPNETKILDLNNMISKRISQMINLENLTNLLNKGKDKKTYVNSILNKLDIDLRLNRKKCFTNAQNLPSCGKVKFNVTNNVCDLNNMNIFNHASGRDGLSGKNKGNFDNVISKDALPSNINV